MRNSAATTGRQRRTKLVGAALVLLSLAGIGLPNGRAQMEYNGGFVQTHREDHDEVPSLAAPRQKARSTTNAPPSYFPDYDFYYPSYYPATISVPRSYYYAGAESGRSVLSPSGRLPFGVSAAALPWNQVDFKDYDEPAETARGSSRTYSLAATPLPPAAPAARPGSAVLIAHLPEHAVFWVEGTRTRSTGRTRYFQSPPLRPGREYSYTVRAAWIEDGRWVSQTRKVLVQAGLIQAIYLRSR